jgi:hypothetical protein
LRTRNCRPAFRFDPGINWFYRRSSSDQEPLMSKPKIPVDEDLAALIREQREAFRRKFGRHPGPDEPLFFDPDEDLPQPISDGNHEPLVEEMAALMEEAGIHPARVHAFRKTGRMVTEENRPLLSCAEWKEWESALREHGRRTDRENQAVALCFRMRARLGRIPRAEQLASDELAIAAMYALEDGVSSFAMEGAFLNGWLILAARRLGITVEAQGIREKMGANVKEICGLLRAFDEELGPVDWEETMRHHLGKVEAARADPGTWLGKPPASPKQAEREMEAAVGFLGYAMTNCSGPKTPPAVVESMLLRAWLRMAVVNDRQPEEFFQRLDRRWPEAAERVDSHLAKTVRPLIQ